MSSIDGMDEVMAQLDGLKDEIRAKAMQGLGEGLKLIVKDAKALAAYVTGDLREHITSRIEDKAGQIDAAVVSTSDHAVYVEMGTGPTGAENHAGIAPVPVTYKTEGWTYRDPETGDYIHTNGQAAQPYLYPAYRNNKPNVLKCVADAINK